MPCMAADKKVEVACGRFQEREGRWTDTDGRGLTRTDTDGHRGRAFFRESVLKAVGGC